MTISRRCPVCGKEACGDQPLAYPPLDLAAPAPPPTSEELDEIMMAKLERDLRRAARTARGPRGDRL